MPPSSSDSVEIRFSSGCVRTSPEPEPSEIVPKALVGRICTTPPGACTRPESSSPSVDSVTCPPAPAATEPEPSTLSVEPGTVDSVTLEPETAPPIARFPAAAKSSVPPADSAPSVPTRCGAARAPSLIAPPACPARVGTESCAPGLARMSPPLSSRSVEAPPRLANVPATVSVPPSARPTSSTPPETLTAPSRPPDTTSPLPAPPKETCVPASCGANATTPSVATRRGTVTGMKPPTRKIGRLIESAWIAIRPCAAPICTVSFTVPTFTVPARSENPPPVGAARLAITLIVPPGASKPSWPPPPFAITAFSPLVAARSIVVGTPPDAFATSVMLPPTSGAPATPDCPAVMLSPKPSTGWPSVVIRTSTGEVGVAAPTGAWPALMVPSDVSPAALTTVMLPGAVSAPSAPNVFCPARLMEAPAAVAVAETVGAAKTPPVWSTPCAPFSVSAPLPAVVTLPATCVIRPAAPSVMLPICVPLLRAETLPCRSMLAALVRAIAPPAVASARPAVTIALLPTVMEPTVLVIERFPSAVAPAARAPVTAIGPFTVRFTPASATRPLIAAMSAAVVPPRDRLPTDPPSTAAVTRPVPVAAPLVTSVSCPVAATGPSSLMSLPAPVVVRRIPVPPALPVTCRLPTASSFSAPLALAAPVTASAPLVRTARSPPVVAKSPNIGMTLADLVSSATLPALPVSVIPLRSIAALCVTAPVVRRSRVVKPGNAPGEADRSIDVAVVASVPPDSVTAPIRNVPVDTLG